jgi:tape measure domain-containing protein
MANDFDALSLGVSLAGVSTVLAGLASLTSSINNTAASADRFSKTAAVFSAAAATIGASALKAYDSFVKFQIGAESLLGTIEGRRFSDAIQKMAVGNAYSADILRRGSQGLVASGMGSARAQGVLGAVTNIAAAGGTDNAGLERALMAIRQINAKGTVRGEEANQQLADTMPLLLKAVQDLTGRNTVVGMSKDEFLNAVVQVGGGKYAGAQENLASRSPGIVLQNTMDNIKNALIPTGLLLAKALILILKPVNYLITAFSKLNEGTGGLLGLLSIFKLLQFAGSMMVNFIRTIIGLTKAEWDQFNALGKVNLALIAFEHRLNGALVGGTGGVGGSSSTAGVHNISDVIDDYAKKRGFKLNPYSTTPLGNVGTIDALSMMKKLPTQGGGFGGLIGNIVGVGSNIAGKGVMGGIGEVFNLIKPLLNVGKLLKGSLITAGIMLVIEVLPRLMGNLSKTFGKLWDSLSKAWESFSKTPLGEVIVGLFDFLSGLWETLVSVLSLDWLVDAMGLEDEVDQDNVDAITGSSSMTAPNRPIRKSDAETFFYSRMTEMV